MALGEADVDKLRTELTDRQWNDWELFYSQEPWGELRADMRALASLLLTNNPKAEVTMIGPNYFSEDEADDAARKAELDRQFAAIGADKIQEALRKGRDAHRAKKQAGVNG